VTLVDVEAVENTISFPGIKIVVEYPGIESYRE